MATHYLIVIAVPTLLHGVLQLLHIMFVFLQESSHFQISIFSSGNLLDGVSVFFPSSLVPLLYSGFHSRGPFFRGAFACGLENLEFLPCDEI